MKLRRPHYFVLATALIIVTVPFLLRGTVAEGLRQRAEQARQHHPSRALSLATWSTRLASSCWTCRLERLNAEVDLGHFAAADESLDQLAFDGASTDEQRIQWRLAAGRSRFAQSRGNEANEHFAAALQLAQQTDLQQLEVDALLASAFALYTWFDALDLAEQRLHHGLQLARELRDQRREAQALSQLGVFYWWYREHRQGILENFYQPALELCRKLGDTQGIADLYSRIAVVYMNRGDLETAGQYLDDSLRLFEQASDLAGQMRLHSYWGSLFSRLENYSQARARFEEARSIATTSGYDYAKPGYEAHLAFLHLREGQFERGVEVYDRLIETVRSPSRRRQYLVDRSNAMLHLGRFAEAQAGYRRALESLASFPGTSLSSRAEILIMLSHGHRLADEFAAAERALEQADAIPLAAKGWANAVLQALARADLASDQRQPRRALDHLLTAAEIENQTFGSASSLFFQTQYRQVFDRLFELLFAGAVDGDHAEALVFRFLEQMRYRSFRSVLVRSEGKVAGPRQISEQEIALTRQIENIDSQLRQHHDNELWLQLRDAYQRYEDLLLRSELTSPRYRQLADSRPIELADLQRALPPRTALVQYVLAGDRAFALVVTANDLSSAMLPVSANQLAPKIKLFRQAIFGQDQPSMPWQPLAAELGRLLIEPLNAPNALNQDGRLDFIEHLVIAPMGVLHDLPFAALHINEDVQGNVHEAGDVQPQRLIDRFTLQQTTSATLWARQARQAPGTPADADMVALGLRHAKGSTRTPLPNAETEATRVAELRGGHALIGPQASEAQLIARAPGARWLHIAAHGVYEPHLPLHSRLILNPSSVNDPDGEAGTSSSPGDAEAHGGNTDGDLTVREILDLDLNAELVSLSACSTGRGTVTSSNPALATDRVGFSEAFLYAGAHNVLATLLPIEDRIGAEFTISFYHHLADMPATEALAITQRQFAAQSRVSAHPRHWAPYVLVGSRDGRLTHTGQ